MLRVATSRACRFTTKASSSTLCRSRIRCSHTGIRPFSGFHRSKDTDVDDVASGDNKMAIPSTSSPTPPSLLESSLRGTGQVIFLNSSTSGAAILGGLAVADPYLATLALAGVTTSTLAAKIAGLDQASLVDGLWGYNGALVGCAAAVFLHPLPQLAGGMDLETLLTSPEMLAAGGWGLSSTVMGASVSPFFGVALKEMMGGVPQWTLAFNAITLGALLQTKSFAAAASSSAPPIEESIVAVTTSTTSLEQTVTMAMLEVPLKGISQIFVVDSSVTGAVIVCGTALYSPGLAGHLVLGSTIGSLTGYYLCAPLGDITCGLWGYNSALTSLGIGTFFVHSPRTVALSVGGAVVTAGLFGAMQVVFGTWGVPCLTLPFCSVMSGCYLLGRGEIPGLLVAASPHSPEKNEYY